MDRLLNFLRRQTEDWRTEIDLLDRGIKTTFEVVDGQKKDTTADTLADRSLRLSELEALIAKHGVKDAHRT